MQSPAKLFQKFQQTGNMDIMAKLFHSKREVYINGLRKHGIQNPEDAMQEAWFNIQRALHAGMFVPGKANVSSWMFRVIFNQAINETRAEALRATVAVEDGVLETVFSEDEETEFLGFDIQELPSIIGLYRMITDASGTKSKAVEYRLMGLTFQEAAKHTGINSVTLRTSHHHAVKEMRALADTGIRNQDFTELDLLQLETTGAQLRQQLGTQTTREKRIDRKLNIEQRHAARLSAKHGINLKNK